MYINRENKKMPRIATDNSSKLTVVNVWFSFYTILCGKMFFSLRPVQTHAN